MNRWIPKMSHTPGPWTAILDHHRVHKRKRMAMVSTSHGRIAIDATNSGATYADDCANARLIAAAPELLAALKQIVDGVEGIWPDARTQAIEAIAKAEGR